MKPEWMPIGFKDHQDLKDKVKELEKQMSDEKPTQALRYNKNKPRLGLIDAYFQEELAKVLTMGAVKYASDNWRKGMSWTECVDSLERHVMKFKSENHSDNDEESNLHHMAHVACNAMFLVWYSKHRQEFDDRYKSPDEEKEPVTDLSG